MKPVFGQEDSNYRITTLPIAAAALYFMLQFTAHTPATAALLSGKYTSPVHGRGQVLSAAEMVPFIGKERMTLEDVTESKDVV